jgi:ABC-type lipoprotein export system ATPase subunit
MVLHDLAGKDLSLFRTIYRYVPMYFPTLIIMIFSGGFYWLLSWYLEKVFPGEYGVPLGWDFLFKRDYWRPEKVDQQPNHIEVMSRRNSMGKPIVHVNHLVKKFGPDKIAVNDVTFDLYENQITSLLGPNGSGKTTIFNCLIGIYKQTSGTITIESTDGKKSDIHLRRSMGYCPQHDILFDLLTIKEQIEFYATARGFEKNKEQIADDLLRLVSLEASANLYCNSLSGGMKRRLSLACAFVGDTKIILLDEVIIESSSFFFN